MADIQSNIDINIDTTNALSSIKNLQRQISLFHQGLRASGSAANAAISDNMSRNLINSINASKQFAASYATVQSATQSFTTSLEKNKFSMGQYFKYAAGSTKTFGRLFKTEFDTIERVAQSRVKTLQTQFIQLGRGAGGAVKAIRVRPLALDMEQLATKTAIAAQKQQLFNQLIKQGSTNLLNFGKNTQWAGRQLMVGFTVPLAYLGTTAARVFMDMEKQIIRLRRVYGDFATTTADTDKMVDSIRQLGNEFTKYGVAVSKTMGLAADAAAMGKQGADLIAQVSEANRLAVLGGVEQAQALETTISVTNAFGVAAEDLASKIDFLNAVENQSVTSIEDLTVAIPKAGPVIQQLGGNVEDLTFFLTAMREGGINASESANALKSGLASLINPSAKASEFMQGFGISIKGIVDSNAGDVKGIVIDMANALDTLDPLNRARAIEQMFGKFQFARISTLFQNVVKEGSQASTVLGLTKATSQELAILSERELKKVEDSPMFKFQKAIEDIKASLVPLGEQFLKLVTPIIEFGTKALEQFNRLDSGVKNFIMGAIGVLGGLAPAAIMAFGLIANGIANLIKTGNFLRNMFVRAGQGTTILGQQTQYMTNEQLEAAAAAASLNQAHQKLTQQFTVEATAVRKLAAAYNDAAIAGARLTGSGAVSRVRGGSGGGKAKGYKSGVLSVPGPKGAGDVVPAMLAPGEAVIPADKAKKYRGFISDMIQDKLPGFKNGNIETSKGSASTISIGGQTFSLGNTFQKEQIDRLKSAASHLFKADPEVALASLANLKNQAIGSGAQGLLRAFAKTAMLDSQALAGRPGAETLKIILPEQEYAGKGQLRSDILSESRGNPQKAVSVPEYVKKNPAVQKEFDMAKNMSRAMYDSIVNSTGEDKEYWMARVAEKQKQYDVNPGKYAGRSAITLAQIAKNITGYDPDGKGNAGHGTEKGHLVAAGALKLDKRAWSNKFTSVDPRVENNLLNTLSQNSYRTKAMFEAMDAVAKSNPTLRGTLDSLKEKILSNASFSEDDRIAFAKATEELSKNKQKYTRGMSPAEIKDSKDFFQTVRLMRDGYRGADLENPTNKGYRTNNAKDTATAFEDLKRVVATEVKARVVASVPKQFRTARKFFGKYAKGVVSVPGPKGAGDVVPAMLSPGEAVIPAAMSKKYAPLIAGMVTDTLPGYNSGLLPPPPPPSYDPNDPFKGIGKPSVGERIKGAAREGRAAGTAFASKAISTGKTIGTSFVRTAAPVAKTIGTGIKDAAVRGLNNGFERTVNSLTKEGRAINQAAKDAKIAAKMGYTADESGNVRNKKGQFVSKDQVRQAVADRKTMNQQRSGRMAQGAMGASMAMGALTMVPGAVGEMASKAMGPMAALSASMSLIPGPAGAVVGVLGAVGIGLMQMKEELIANRKEAMKTALAFSSGREAMQKLAEYAGTINPSEAMGRMRAERRAGYSIVTGKNTFGAGYLGSAPGQELLTQAKNAKLSAGSNIASSNIGIQLSQAVVSNIITPEEAASIAFNLGEAMQDFDFAVDVNAKMVELLGPNGENLQKDPLQIQANIMQEKGKTLTASGGAVDRIRAYTSTGRVGTGLSVSDTIASEAEAQVSQGIGDIIDMGQQNLDNLELQHLKRLDILKAAGDLEKIDEAINEYNADRTKILNANTGALKEQRSFLQSLEDSGGRGKSSAEQIVDNMENALEELYKDADQTTRDAARVTIENISDQYNAFGETLSFADKATLVGTITVENMDMFKQLQATFPVTTNVEFWRKVAQISVEYGQGATEEMMAFLPNFGTVGKAEQFIDYTLRIKQTDPAGAQSAIDTMTAISKTKDAFGKPINLDQYIDSVGNVTAKFTALQNKFTAVNKMFDKAKGKKVTYKILSETTGIELAKSAQDYFNSLPPDQQKIYTTTYLTVMDTIDVNSKEGKARLNAFRREMVAKQGGNSTLANYWQNASFDVLKTAYAESESDKKTYAPTETKPKNTTGGDPADKTGGSQTSMLDGLLMKLKLVRQGAVNAAGGMAEIAKWMKTGALQDKDGLMFAGLEQQLQTAGYNEEFINLISSNLDEAIKKKFVTMKKGIITVTQSGEDLSNLLSNISIGAYERSIRPAIEASQKEVGARKDLLSLQKDIGMSYDEIVVASRDSALAQEIHNIKITKGITNKQEEIKKVIKLYKEEKAAIESTKTAEEQFNDLTTKVNKKFDADRNKISIDFELKTSGDKSIIAAAQQQINEVRNQIDDYNAGLTRLEPVEEAINKKYDDRIASLENIRDLNDRIAEQKNAELDISAALARGDVGAAAEAMQKEQQRQAKEAMDAKIRNLEKQRDDEINGLTTRVQINGQTLMLTKEQINKRVKDLEMQIFNIEEDRLEPAQARIDLAMYERDVKLKALDDEKLKWDQLKNKIDLASTAAISYAETLKEAIRLAELAAKAYTNPTAPKAPVEENWDQAYLTKATMDSITKANPRLEKKLPEMLANSSSYDWSKIPGMSGSLMYKAKGGMIPSYFANGDLARGTDTVPAMLTPGEFIMSKYAVDTYGVDTMKAMNSGELSGGSVYNSYAVNVNVRSDANPDQIARAVMGQIRQVNSQQLRGRI
jgi:TP901 family phage tail tape measure protein